MRSMVVGTLLIVCVGCSHDVVFGERGTAPGDDGTATGDPADPADPADPPDGDDGPDDPSDPVDPPPVSACQQDAARRVFVTREVFSGDLGGVSGADAMCQSAADDAGLGGAWRAFMSDVQRNAIDRIDSDGPFCLVDEETVVFETKAALTAGGPAAPFDRDQFGAPAAWPLHVWTGSTTEGTSVEHKYTCDGWSAGSVLVGAVGDFSRGDEAWLYSQNTVCGIFSADGGAHLYCFED